MAIHMPPPSKWSAKHIIHAALMGTLAAIAVAAVVSISLAPAGIHFSIAGETPATVLSTSPSLSNLNFTLVVKNTSWRTRARFTALSAEVKYRPARSSLGEINTTVLPCLRPLRNMTALVQLNRTTEGAAPLPAPAGAPAPAAGGHDDASPPPTASTTDDAEPNWPICEVVVVAKVWFKFGFAATKTYHVRASCWPVNFYNHTDRVDCIP